MTKLGWRQVQLIWHLQCHVQCLQDVRESNTDAVNPVIAIETLADDALRLRMHFEANSGSRN